MSFYPAQGLRLSGACLVVSSGLISALPVCLFQKNPAAAYLWLIMARDLLIILFSDRSWSEKGSFFRVVSDEMDAAGKKFPCHDDHQPEFLET
jgi:hypothetical protein